MTCACGNEKTYATARGCLLGHVYDEWLCGSCATRLAGYIQNGMALCPGWNEKHYLADLILQDGDRTLEKAPSDARWLRIDSWL